LALGNAKAKVKTKVKGKSKDFSFRLPGLPAHSLSRRGSPCIALLLPFTFCLGFHLISCAPTGPRPFYSRSAGDWVAPGDGNYASSPPVALAAFRPSPGAESGLRKTAESYLGTPYRFGGQSRNGMDCSGYVRQVFQEALGLRLPRNSASMARQGRDISRDDLKPGDLVFFRGFLSIDHVGIYMGGGYFIHSQSGVGVTYTKLDAPYFGAHYAGARRITG
jgi:cell wall-associated NlpC family hydrolase